MSASINYRQARAKGERLRLYLTVAPACLVGFYFLAEQFAKDDSLGIGAFMSSVVLFLGVTGVALFLIRLTQKQFLGNALHVERTHFAHIAEISTAIASTLKMQQPDIFIFQDPYLNAFALGFKRPYTIALHSATVEGLSEVELQAIIAHEMGHIYFNHTKITAFTAPVGSSLPGLGYVFGFWARKAELSCDRLALMITRNPTAVIDALIKIHIGPHFLEQLDAEGVLFQDYESRGIMGALAQTMSDHPFMTTRIKTILKLAQEMGLQYTDSSGKTVCLNCGLKVKARTEICERCHYHFPKTAA